MHLSRIALATIVAVLGVALLATASPVPKSKVKAIGTGGSLQAPSRSNSQITTQGHTSSIKAKATPVKPTKAKTIAKAQVKATKVKATTKATISTATTILSSKPLSTSKTTTVPVTSASQGDASTKINSVCSLPGAHRRADCATPPTIDCTSFDTCHSCVSLSNNQKCAFDKSRKKCDAAPATSNPTRFASTDANCAKFEQGLIVAAAKKEKDLQIQATKIFGRLRPGASDSLQAHLGSTQSKKLASGRHLFSIWKNNLVVANTIQPDPTTRLANLDTSSVDAKIPTKTVWIDAHPVGDTGAIYTRDQIDQMCIDAIVQVLKNEKGQFRNVPGATSVASQSHKIVVQGINLSRVCMAISDQSCFPFRTTPQQLPLGASCG